MKTAIGISNWEKQYQDDLLDGKLIIVNNKNAINSRKMVGENNSIFSSEFGVSIVERDEQAESVKSYSCNCGKIYGKYYETTFCEHCQTVVKETYGANIKKTGFIPLFDTKNKNYKLKKNSYKIINPTIYEMLCDFFSRPILNKIINLEEFAKTSLNGQFVLPIKEKITNVNKYYYIGFNEFRLKFNSIVKHYMYMYTNKKYMEKKMKLGHFLLKIHNENKIFTSVILVMNTLLRPATSSPSRKKITYSDINSYYMQIISNVATINKIKVFQEADAYKIDCLLYDSQSIMQNLWDILIKNKFATKETSHIKEQLIATRCTFSARSVVIPFNDPQNAALNRTIIGYKMFMRLFQYELLNLMMKMDTDLTIYNAYNYFLKSFNSSKRDDYMIRLCRYFIKHTPEIYGGGPVVAIFRNPILSIGSIQCFVICDIFDDPNVSVLAISLMSLDEYNGDFDGDAFGILSPKELRTIMAFKNGLDPNNLLLDKDGGINSSFMLKKDQLMILYRFLDHPFEESGKKKTIEKPKNKPILLPQMKFNSTKEINSVIKDIGDGYIKDDGYYDKITDKPENDTDENGYFALFDFDKKVQRGEITAFKSKEIDVNFYVEDNKKNEVK